MKPVPEEREKEIAALSKSVNPIRLKNNPINYSEFLFDLLKNNDYKKIFEFAVDNNHRDLACSVFRKDRFVQVFNLISTFIQFNSFEKKGSRKNNRFIMKEYCYDGLSEKEANALKEEEESEKKRLLDSLERLFVLPIKLRTSSN